MSEKMKIIGALMREMTSMRDACFYDIMFLCVFVKMEKLRELVK